MGGSGISWTICKSFAPRSKQITTPVPHHSVFTGRMPFLPPNQQRQSTEGTNRYIYYLHNKTFRINHPDLLNSILFCGAFFTHCRHQQVSRANGSLTNTPLALLCMAEIHTTYTTRHHSNSQFQGEPGSAGCLSFTVAKLCILFERPKCLIAF